MIETLLAYCVNREDYMTTDWGEDRARYERENPQWKITENNSEAWDKELALREKDKKLAAWVKLALGESREEFYIRVEREHPSLNKYCEERRWNLKTKKKRGPTKEVINLKARVKELEDIVAKLMGEINA